MKPRGHQRLPDFSYPWLEGGRKPGAEMLGERGSLLAWGFWWTPNGEVVRVEEQKQLSAVRVPFLNAVAAASLSFSRGEPLTRGNMNFRGSSSPLGCHMTTKPNTDH